MRRRWMVSIALWLGVGLVAATVGQGEETTRTFLEFIRQQARTQQENAHAGETPTDAPAWQSRNPAVRAGLAKAWGDWPAVRPPNVRKLGELQRDGYRLEKLALETMPGVWMTAHTYVPAGEGKRPAILQVHGHWAGAKQDPHVQARCLGAVKHGFFVLAVDAFGAGERGLTKNLGEYHGEMVASTLYPVGTPLSGLQVYENMRAVDYLQSRPEVDGAKIGITGASGGGNQTMYAGAWDTRFGAAVPVCSVGNYQAYLGAACCMCEVVPGALQFTEEWSVLGLTAPRGLMVVSATRDAFQFSVGEAKKSLTKTETVYAVAGKPGSLRHAVFESPHDYNQEMRQAMYGWMKLHLAGEGDGSPLPDPPMTLEDPEAIRCYPGDSRPADWVTLPQYAAREGQAALAAVRQKGDPESLKSRRETLRKTFLAAPNAAPTQVSATPSDEGLRFSFAPEPGLSLTGLIAPASAPAAAPTAILLDLEGAETARRSDLARELLAAGYRVVTCDLRATGAGAVAGDHIGRAPDHNSAEWSLWVGRPLLGQWVHDLRQLLKALEQPAVGQPDLLKNVTIIGRGPAGLIPIAWSAAGEADTPAGVRAIAATGTLGSYVHPAPYEGQRLGTMLPGVLRDVGDIADLVGLGRHPALLINMTDGGGQPLTPQRTQELFAVSPATRQTLGTSAAVETPTGLSVPQIVEALRKSAAAPQP